MTTQDEANEAQNRASLSQLDATGAQRDATAAQERVSPVERAAHETAKTQRWIRRLATVAAVLMVALGLVSSFYSIRGDVDAQATRAEIAANTAYLISCTVPVDDLPTATAEERRHKVEESEHAALGKRCFENAQKRTDGGPVLAIINETDRRVCIRLQQTVGGSTTVDCSIPIPLPPTTVPANQGTRP